MANAKAIIFLICFMLLPFSGGYTIPFFYRGNYNVKHVVGFSPRAVQTVLSVSGPVAAKSASCCVPAVKYTVITLH
jgi:hypothetical protein